MTRFYKGCDLLLFAKITHDTKELYLAEKPARLETLCGVSLPPSRSIVQVFKDGEPIGTIGQRNDATINIKIPAISEKLRAYLLGEESGGDYYIDTGRANTPFFAVGFRLLQTDRSYKYFWFNKGTISINSRSIDTEQGTNTAGEEIIFTPILTNKLFNNKPCKSVSIDSFATTHEINANTWAATVWTPDNFNAVQPPIILANSDVLAVGDIIAIDSPESNIEYRTVIE
jgi:phi13 family phage major tail protein